MDTSDSYRSAMTWWGYVRKHSNDSTHTEIGRRVGITGSSVSRWGKGSLPDPAQAAAFARAYSRPVLEAFLAAGFLTSTEARQRPAAPTSTSLQGLSDDELLAEIGRRMKEGGQDAGQAEAEKKPDDDGGVGAVIRGLPSAAQGRQARGERITRQGQEVERAARTDDTEPEGGDR